MRLRLALLGSAPLVACVDPEASLGKKFDKAVGRLASFTGALAAPHPLILAARPVAEMARGTLRHPAAMAVLVLAVVLATGVTRTCAIETLPLGPVANAHEYRTIVTLEAPPPGLGNVACTHSLDLTPANFEWAAFYEKGTRIACRRYFFVMGGLGAISFRGGIASPGHGIGMGALTAHPHDTLVLAGTFWQAVRFARRA